MATWHDAVSWLTGEGVFCCHMVRVVVRTTPSGSAGRIGLDEWMMYSPFLRAKGIFAPINLLWSVLRCVQRGILIFLVSALLR